MTFLRPCQTTTIRPAPARSRRSASEAFERLEMEMKASFHAYNKGMVRLLKRARSRAGLYLSRPTALVADVRKYLSWC